MSLRAEALSPSPLVILTLNEVKGKNLIVLRVNSAEGQRSNLGGKSTQIASALMCLAMTIR